MIKISLARDEWPPKGKLPRLILEVGDFRIHITRKEARKMRNRLNRFKLD
jgi:hypothetical protein